MQWMQLRFDFDRRAFDACSTACQRSLNTQWRNTGRWFTSSSQADLFIYLGRSAAGRSWRSSSNGRSAVESQSNRSCNHGLTQYDWRSTVDVPVCHTYVTSGMNARGSSSVIGCHCICCWISWTRSKFFNHIIFASSSSTRKSADSDASQKSVTLEGHSVERIPRQGGI